MQLLKNQRLRVASGQSSCEVTFLEPQGLTITQTDRFDPPPRPRVKLTEYHLTAATGSPVRECEFVTLLRPCLDGQKAPEGARLLPIQGGWAVEADLSVGKAIVLLGRRAGATLKHGPVETDSDAAAACLSENGRITRRFDPRAK